MSLKDDFDAAVKRVNTLAKAPSAGEMLELYGYYKQATVGDSTGARPGMLDVKGRAKFDAWAGRKGLTIDAAMTGYLALARRLGA